MRKESLHPLVDRLSDQELWHYIANSLADYSDGNSYWYPQENQTKVTNARQKLETAEAASQGFGVHLEQESERQRLQLSDLFDIAVLSYSHRAEGKTHTADFAHHYLWKTHVQYAGDFWFFVGFCFDGATPIIPGAMWPSDLVELAAYNDGDFCKPDILWRTIMQAILSDCSGDTNFPIEYVSTYEKAKTANSLKNYIKTLIFDKVDIGIHKAVRDEVFDANGVCKIIIEKINETLVEIYNEIFSDYSQERFAFYPYGIGGVQVAVIPATSEALQYLNYRDFDWSQLTGAAYTGDTGIAHNIGYEQYIRANDNELVDAHDVIRHNIENGLDVLLGSAEIGRLMLEIGAKHFPQYLSQVTDESVIDQLTAMLVDVLDQKVLNALVATYRNPLIGCLPTPELFRTGFSRSIRFPTNNRYPDPSFERVSDFTSLIYTDGAKALGFEDPFAVSDWSAYVAPGLIIDALSIGGRSSTLPKIDVIAGRLAANRTLAVLEARVNALQHTNWRPDDIAVNQLTVKRSGNPIEEPSRGAQLFNS